MFLFAPAVALEAATVVRRAAVRASVDAREANMFFVFIPFSVLRACERSASVGRLATVAVMFYDLRLATYGAAIGDGSGGRKLQITKKCKVQSAHFYPRIPLFLTVAICHRDR